jgi:hypothetical protein
MVLSSRRLFAAHRLFILNQRGAGMACTLSVHFSSKVVLALYVLAGRGSAAAGAQGASTRAVQSGRDGCSPAASVS